jgi:hypothetical protein
MLEVSDLMEELWKRWKIKEMPLMAVMMPEMG